MRTGGHIGLGFKATQREIERFRGTDYISGKIIKSMNKLAKKFNLKDR